MPERLVRAAVQAGLEAAGGERTLPFPASVEAAWVAQLLEVVADLDTEWLIADAVNARPLRFDVPVVGFDAPAAEGTGHVPWYAD
jgi:hypothetical protein